MSVVVGTNGSVRERHTMAYRDLDDGPAADVHDMFDELFEDDFLDVLGIDG